MKQKIPTIKSLMTPFPYSIDIGEQVGDARKMMDGHDIHHLPVTKNRTLIAVLNSHDLKAYSGSDEANIRQLRLKKAYIVDLSVPADQVLMTMADKHLSVALVTRKEKLVGLFTGTDALRAFAEHLRPDISTGGDSAA